MVAPTIPASLCHNHNSFKPFTEFISKTIMDRIAVGAVGVHGRVGQGAPPTINCDATDCRTEKPSPMSGPALPELLDAGYALPS